LKAVCIGWQLRRAGVLGSACMLLSCASPYQSMALPGLGADEAYLMGRQHQLARAPADALRLYRDALRADPRHVNARNGLATVLAEQGEYKAAIAIWQDLIAQSGDAAWLFGNLGYAYFLDGQYAAAQQAQERACLLEPANAQAWQRLSATLEKRGDLARALRTQRQALTLLEHDAQADAVLANTVADGWPTSTLVAGPDGLLTLQRNDATRTGMTAPATLEIANGNGVPGAARAVALRVHDPALRVVRLSNENGFAVRRTRIEYRPSALAVARRLAQQVQPDAVLIEAPPHLATSLRLVLGRH
jgi:tetratricopeptide (TPR) repeat protein